MTVKQRALRALRQRKYQEQLLSRTDAQLQSLQELVSSIEFTQIQATIAHGLSVGNEVLKQLHAEMSLNKVERLIDQTREGVAYQRVCILLRFVIGLTRWIGDRRDALFENDGRGGGGCPERVGGTREGGFGPSLPAGMRSGS